MEQRLDPARSADVIDFLQAGLNTAERQWPLFEPRLRAIRDVPMGELRTHPDLVLKVQSLAPDDAWILMGGVVLVSPDGAAYAIGLGTHTLAFRTGARSDGPRVETPRPPSMGGGSYALPDYWQKIDPWTSAELEAAARSARAAIDDTTTS